jgi:hypothetical protein
MHQDAHDLLVENKAEIPFACCHAAGWLAVC